MSKWTEQCAPHACLSLLWGVPSRPWGCPGDRFLGKRVWDPLLTEVWSHNGSFTGRCMGLQAQDQPTVAVHGPQTDWEPSPRSPIPTPRPPIRLKKKFLTCFFAFHPRATPQTGSRPPRLTETCQLNSSASRVRDWLPRPVACGGGGALCASAQGISVHHTILHPNADWAQNSYGPGPPYTSVCSPGVIQYFPLSIHISSPLSMFLHTAPLPTIPNPPVQRGGEVVRGLFRHRKFVGGNFATLGNPEAPTASRTPQHASQCCTQSYKQLK